MLNIGSGRKYEDLIIRFSFFGKLQNWHNFNEQTVRAQYLMLCKVPYRLRENQERFDDVKQTKNPCPILLNGTKFFCHKLKFSNFYIFTT